MLTNAVGELLLSFLERILKKTYIFGVYFDYQPLKVRMIVV